MQEFLTIDFFWPVSSLHISVTSHWSQLSHSHKSVSAYFSDSFHLLGENPLCTVVVCVTTSLNVHLFTEVMHNTRRQLQIVDRC